MHRFQQNYKKSQVQISMLSKLPLGWKRNLQKERPKQLSNKTHNFVQSVDNKMVNQSDDLIWEVLKGAFDWPYIPE